ncbi:small nucleolar ribonucleoprotein-like protein complex subunit [Lentithecium fluviatile CBS 122367]|uniref:Small nucleolar ribonucleoprotein-like protein complex subunit n=1 Tax=Lentithecium fluviatile CBS 122367 TaxID=1168545 RepID=A0A6G1J3N5_9PLEO|nr:small nucleolar ribonucleoprotein-like protein complex subunit [Lentithecium fluviatile CBS 122367]
MSSFFTVPASQRKRKRTEKTSVVSKKRSVAPTSAQAAKAPRRAAQDESISGSDESDDERDTGFFEGPEDSETSEEEGETAAEKRLRLAERYLENIKNEVQEDGGFDAAEIDRDLIAERLKEDVAETKGKIYRNIADQLDFDDAVHVFGRSGLQKAVTGCALRLPYAWIVSKDLTVEKWEVADPRAYSAKNPDQPANMHPRRTPKRLLWRKGNKNKKGDRDFLGHTGEIISVALSDSGRFLATGDKHARLIIWDADTLTPRKLFTRHRDAVTSLSFRRGTEQLFSGGADRAVLVWSAAESAYIETLHGHEDTVIGVAGGLDPNQETCVSVGSRDRSARLWKVVEENQLVFRSGGTARQKGMDKLRKGRFGANVDKTNGDETSKTHEDEVIAYAEGSMDCVALLDAGLFVTGSDNGGLSLWSVNRKKPLYTVPLAHGRDLPVPAEKMSANIDAATSGKKGPRLPRYITAIATVPFADLILTASWDGWIRAWRVGPDKRTIEPVGKVGRVPQDAEDAAMNGDGPEEDEAIIIRGIVNGLSVQERGDRGKEGLCIVAAVGKEPRLGRWMVAKVPNRICIFEVPRKALANGVSDLEDDEDEE